MLLLQRLKRIITEKGFLLTSALAIICLLFFFGKLLKHPNTVYFGNANDGLQSYYTSLYHVKYDSTYWKMNAMNYPYGEQVFFTGCQPFITNPIKLISKVIDISNYTVGILNLIMLFSIFLSALCLYLLFKQLRLPYIYASVAATAIAFLSPQLIRLVGHYSLTYQFAIPLFLLLIFKFYYSPSFKKSIAISILVFFMAGTHFYFFGFFAFIAAFYWCFSFLSKMNFNNLLFSIKHFSIQIVMPFLFFQCIIFLIDNVTDRTAHPWGYLVYTTNTAGVFYPFYLPYEPLFAKFISPELPASIEGYNYIGIVAIIVCILIFLQSIKLLVLLKFKKAFNITDNVILNCFFWTSIAALIISFGYPFKIKGYENWLNNIGLLQQMRGIARFIWIFYYVINIIAFYKIYNWIKNKNKILKTVALFIPLFLISFDAYFTTSPKEYTLNNTIPRLDDKENKLLEDKWLNEINIKNYQAIISLPYFHIGSENIWMVKESSPIVSDVYITSLKTGIPTINSSMSRTSLSQTFKNIQLVLEPYRKLDIIKDFKNNKPFLVLVKEDELNDDEKKLLTNCKKIKETKLFNVYELEVSTLDHLNDNLYATTSKTLEQTNTYKVDNFIYTDSIQTFVYCNFNDSISSEIFMDKECYEGKIKDVCFLFEDKIPNIIPEQTYTVSFWMDNFTEDLYPRLLYGVECFDSENKSYAYTVCGMRDKLKIIDGKKALIENNIVLKHKRDRIRITIGSNEITDERKMFRADELFIYPTKDTIYKVTNNSVMINNRTYNK